MSLEHAVLVPGPVEQVLRRACYDCHSNNTRYPWYAHIEPVGWMLDWHVRKGKSMLNFNEFVSYSSRQQVSKLRGIRNSMQEETMPLASYERMHKKARLTKEERSLLANWAETSADSLLAAGDHK